MSIVPSNVLQAVQTYQKAELAYLQNLTPMIKTSNTRYKNFTRLPGNLGATVTYDIPPLMTVASSLVGSLQPAVERVRTITCNLPFNSSFAFTSQDLLFNINPLGYMNNFGKASVKALGTTIERNVASVTETIPFRFYGDGRTAINSFQQLAQAIANFEDYGSVLEDRKMYLPNTVVPPIIGSGLNQFVLRRNEEMAQSWELGTWDNTEYYCSNQMPTHTAGTIGNENTVLTVVSTNSPTGANITEITFSGAGTDANAIKQWDRFQFVDNVTGQPNLRFLQPVGKFASSQRVQFLATANSASSAGNVTVTISPALVSQPGATQNINSNIVAGMQCRVMPNSKLGLLTAGNPLFVALPPLPDMMPYPTAYESDPDTQVSLRHYYGAVINGNNAVAYYRDVILGYDLDPERSMAILFPA